VALLNSTHNTYSAVYVLDDNQKWFVRVTELQGAHSYGRTIAAARRNIRQAVAVVLDAEEHTFNIVDDIRVPDQTALEKVLHARAVAAQVATEADSSLRRYVRLSPLSERDLAELLGMSHQRIHQLRAA
jgi:predicted RNase H-like HicB family nuclease